MGVPKGLTLTEADRAIIEDELDGIFPVDARLDGILFDAFVSNPDINRGYDFGRIQAPTLVIHARDDSLAAYQTAVALVGRIPGARLLTVERGGHVMLGEHSEIPQEIQAHLRSAGSEHPAPVR